VRLLGDLPVRRAQQCTVKSWGAATQQGSARSANEDAWGQRGERAFVVADGMGGRPGGAEAAVVAVAALLDALERRPDDPAPIDWHATMVAVNDAVRASAMVSGYARNGAAIAALLLQGPRALIAHLGDVRIYRCRSGRDELLTTDHTVAEELRHAGIDPRRADLRPGELSALTAYLGDRDSAQGYSMRAITVAEGDRLVVCTDGVHRAMRPSTSAIGALADPAAAERLVAAAVAAGATDDATALVCTLGLRHPPPREAAS
jgi:PPM family protein phosphatase